MTRADCKALRSAALQLIDWANTLRASYQTKAGCWDPTVVGAGNGKAMYERHMATAKRLRAIANAEQANLPKRGVGLTTCDMP